MFPNCVKCNKKSCLRCKANFGLDPITKVCVRCKNTNFFEPGNPSCLKCDYTNPQCITCTDKNTCTKCKEPFLLEDKRCKPCGVDEFFDKDLKFCRPCSEYLDKNYPFGYPFAAVSLEMPTPAYNPRTGRNPEQQSYPRPGFTVKYNSDMVGKECVKFYV